MQVEPSKSGSSVAPGLNPAGGAPKTNEGKGIECETDPTGFWNALAPYHASIENSYLDRPSLRRIIGVLRQPVLVVGAGRGLLVEELRNRGFKCDGLDFSSEMIRYAGLRCGLTLIQADARSMPFENGAYETIIYATGVVDFRHLDNPRALIHAAPEEQPYRNEAEVRRLFERLQIPIKQMQASASCYMLQI